MSIRKVKNLSVVCLLLAFFTVSSANAGIFSFLTRLIAPTSFKEAYCISSCVANCPKYDSSRAMECEAQCRSNCRDL
jgi:hypothetical protein